MKHLGFVLLMLAGTVWAQPYEEAARTAAADLAGVLEALAEFRKQVAAERPPLARETAALASELRIKRTQLGLDRQQTGAAHDESARLASTVQNLEEEQAYISTLLGELENTLRVGMHPAELDAETARFPALPDTTSRLDLVDFGIARLAGAGGLRTQSGEVIDPHGLARSGTFIEAGPVQWFVGGEGDRESGLVRENRKLQAELVPGTEAPRVLAALRDGKSAAPSFDPTLGGAHALDAVTGGGMVAHIQKGGVWIVPILLIAAMALLAALLKWLQLLRIRRVRPAIVGSVLSQLRGGDVDAATSLAIGLKHPARDLLTRGIELRGEPRDTVEEALYETYLEAQPRLGRWLPFVRIAAATAPLLGLLGTVTGMIHTFELINLYGTGDAKTLAGGISEALVTTEFGLVVAIPALLLHAWLSRRVESIRAEMEMISLAFINGIDRNHSAAAGGTDA